MNQLRFLLGARFLMVAARTLINRGTDTLVTARWIDLIDGSVVELGARGSGLDRRELCYLHATMNRHVILAGCLDGPFLDRD